MRKTLRVVKTSGSTELRVEDKVVAKLGEVSLADARRAAYSHVRDHPVYLWTIIWCYER